MKKQLAILAFAVMIFGAAPAGAQNQQDDQYGPDPYAPSSSNQNYSQDQSSDAQPGVARLSFIHGDVSSQRGDNGEWVAATLNTPVAVGDRVSTGQGGRAELQLDYANILRLSDGATAKVANITRNSIQVQVGQGLVTYSVLRGTEAAAEIDTPNATIHPNGPGEYRILVNSDGETQVTVRDGSAEVSEPQGSTQVERGQMITIQGTDNPQYQIGSAPARDGWDSWNDDRDHRISGASSWHRTNRYYTGSEDLDSYGAWSEVPDYGPVWIPRQDPGWAPYSDGRWVWEPYWGWTWVSYEPWGWAPYHYGRWFVYGGNWAWWPGPVVTYPAYYPVWAPAYVSFFGWGGGGWGVSFGFGFGFGHVGWLPCGPGDWYHPWYGRWGGRYNTINITNVHNTNIVNNFHNGFGPLGPRGERSFSNVNEAFRNERVRNGFVSMDSNRFGREAVSGRHGISESEFRGVSMVSGKMPLGPSRESYSPTNRAANPGAFRGAPPSTQRFFTGNVRSNTGLNAQGNRSFNAPNSSPGGPQGFGDNRGGTFNRGPSQPTNSARASNSAPITSSRPGWHTFTPPQSSGGNRPSQGFSGNSHSTFEGSSRPSYQRGQVDNRGSSQQGYNAAPRPSQPQDSGRGFSQPNQNQQYHEFRPPTSSSRSGSSNSYQYSRPPLNMRQPIVTPRGGSGGYNSRGNSAPRPSYSAPRGGGNGGGNYHGGGGGHSNGGSGGSHGGGGRSR